MRSSMVSSSGRAGGRSVWALGAAVALVAVACTGGADSAGGTSPTRPPAPASYTASGEVTADETWWGEIRLTGPIELPSGVTLTIRAGTVVTLGASRGGPPVAAEDLVVRAGQGRLVVEGTADQPVVFWPADYDGDGGQWGGLEIGEGSVVEYAELWFAGSAAVEASGGRVEHSRIIRPWGAGISGRGAFTDNVIIEAGETGISCTGEAEVRRNIIVDTPTGIEVAGDSRTFSYTVANNLVVDAGTGIRLQERRFAPAGPLLVANNTVVITSRPPWARFDGGRPQDLVDNTLVTGIEVGGIAAAAAPAMRVVDNVVAGAFVAPISTGVWSGPPQQVLRDMTVARNLTFGSILPGAVRVHGGEVEMLDPEEVQADPRFVDPAAGDYRLAAESPAIDTGDPASEDADGSPADRGAYGGPDPLAGLVPLASIDRLLRLWRPLEEATPDEPAVNATTSGWIEADEVWRGEVRLTGSVLLAAGVTLTIEAGTRVLVAPLGDERGHSAGFTAQGLADADPALQEWAARAIVIDGRHGRIFVDGTAEQPVVFLPDTSAPVPGLWQGIVIGSGYLRHCDIGYGGIAAVQVVGPDVEVAHCAIHDQSFAGIDLLGANGAHLHHNLVVGSPFGIGPMGGVSLFGLWLRWPAWTADSGLLVEFNRVEASYQCLGVPVAGSVVRHNILRGCQFGMALTPMGFGRASVRLRHNTMARGEGLSLDTRLGDLVVPFAAGGGRGWQTPWPEGLASTPLLSISGEFLRACMADGVCDEIDIISNIFEGWPETGISNETYFPGGWWRNLYWKPEPLGSWVEGGHGWNEGMQGDHIFVWLPYAALGEAWNLFGKAVFIDPEAWDYHLAPGSPGIDSGLDSCLDPDGSICDSGAFGGPEAGGWEGAG